MAAQPQPVLADAAGVLTDRLHQSLLHLAALVGPVSAGMDRQFRSRLRALRLDPLRIRALSAISLGSICNLLTDGAGLDRAFEEISYQGRRLAKLDMRPQEVVRALLDYDKALAPALRHLTPQKRADIHWVQEQMHFCTVLILNQSFYQVREAESRTFYQLSRQEAAARGLAELLLGSLETLARYVAADAAQIYLAEPDGARWTLRASVPARPGSFSLRAPRRADTGTDDAAALDPSWAREFRRVWSIPLRDGSRVAGVMQFAFSRDYTWLPRERDLLAAAAERCLFAAERVRMMEDLVVQRDQIRRLAERVMHVEESERRRISRELHDEAGQGLLCIRLQLEILERTLPAGRAAEKKALGEIREITDRTILEIRRVIADLSPSVLDRLGFAAAVRQLANRLRRLHGCRVKVRLSGLNGLSKEMCSIAYRLLQECCNNIAKHSQATHVILSARTADGKLKLLVEDDGVGFDPGAALSRRETHGLAGIQERLTVLGGACRISSRQAGRARKTPSGTTLQMELPLQQTRDQEVRAAG